MNLADLLPTVRELSTPQKLTLFEELRSDLKSSSQTASEWDLSASSIAGRNTAVLALLD
jgi:hypothetical protein